MQEWFGLSQRQAEKLFAAPLLQPLAYLGLANYSLAATARL